VPHIDVVAEAGGGIQTLSVEIAEPRHGANLLRKRLDDGVALEAGMRDVMKKYSR